MLGYNSVFGNITDPMMRETGGCSNCNKSGGKKKRSTKKGGNCGGETSQLNMDGGSKRKRRSRKTRGGEDNDYNDYNDNEMESTPVDERSGGKKRKASKNPYIIFVKKNYKSMAAKHPNLKATQIMKKISEMYKAQKK